MPQTANGVHFQLYFLGQELGSNTYRDKVRENYYIGCSTYSIPYFNILEMNKGGHQ
jgi:hypothetical protein